MEVENCQVGDIVYLNSGGPAMTITLIRKDIKGCLVEWVVDGAHKYTEFPLVCVTKTPKDIS